jgi:hypothetical protein
LWLKEAAMLNFLKTVFLPLLIIVALLVAFSNYAWGREIVKDTKGNRIATITTTETGRKIIRDNKNRVVAKIEKPRKKVSDYVRN